MAAIRNKLFYKYGHDCELASTRDELPMYRSGGNLLEQIKNTLQRSMMTSDDNIDSLKYLKSQKNVERERLRHLPYKMMIHPFSDSRQTWDTIMVCVLVLAYIIIPVDIATSNFPLQNSITDNTAWKLLRFTLDMIMCGDVVLNFLTGYWDPQRSEFMEIVISSRSSSRKYLEMVRELTEYMRHKQLPVALQNRLLEYYEFKFQKSYFRESEILNVISGQLKQDLLMHSCRKLVEHVGFFQNLPTPLILRIVSALTIEVYMVNDVIVKIGTPGICMYFIASGCVAIYTRNGYEVSHLEDGEYFGEYSLLKQQEPREHSVIAVEICELYRLEYSDFVKVIMSYPDLIEKITKHALERIEATEFTAARYDRRKRRR
ncbi:i[[h]] channel isoform e [Holotrichia oblita]|uniref:I[[h]] channel isoform e n=1 Tax=Holotrichia oblita TaxID=644536 RepID=A0ACB9TK38_HOLOL|nr:i[[h]] channel isoform e [Holotrichia oblita]